MNKEIGIVGLGKMGGNIARSLVEEGYEVVGYDIDPDAADAIDGVEPADDHGELADALTAPRLVWLSVPAGEAVDEALDSLLPHLDEGDVVIDGGNSNFERTQERFERLQAENVHLLDAGCSGGPSGARNGLSIMVGGERDVFEDVEEVFDLLSVEDGYAYFGDAGAGHYVKMVHNGVEYVMMQALGEGYQLLAEGPYDPDLEDVSHVWSNGSVIESRLVRLCRNVFEKKPSLEGVKGHVPDSGEGRWSLETAIKHDVPATGIAHSLFARYRSRTGDEGTFADKLVSMLRHEFGGHDVETKND